MTAAHREGTLLRTGVRLYRAALILFPRDFRRAYGPEMVQVVRTALPSSSVRTAARLLLAAFGDLLVSAARERMGRATAEIRSGHGTAWGAALLVALAAGYLHMRTDADGMSLLLLVAGAFFCGAVWPRSPWRWAVIIGLSASGIFFLGHGVHVRGSRPDEGTSPLWLLVPLILCAYAGAVAGLARRIYPA